jgi:hypothetical protein
VIDESRVDIDNLEAEIRTIQCVFDDMVQEIKAKLEQRIKEITGKVKI